MPEARLKQEASEPENEIVGDKVQQISSSFLMKTFERICTAMSASGVVLAVRDPEGVRCLVSAGNAPAVGSRLQPDSAFTRACLETGEMVVCKDAENDSRIHPSVAKALHLRSAAAVPIKSQGSVIGVIEVFFPRPSDIDPVDVAVLKGLAKFSASLLSMDAGPPERPHPECEKTTTPGVRWFEPVAKTQPQDPIYTASPILVPSDSVPVAPQSPDSGDLAQDDGDRIVRDLRSALSQSDAARRAQAGKRDYTGPNRSWRHHRRRIWNLIFWALIVLAAIIAAGIAITEWAKT